MAFLPSTSPDVTESIPAVISARTQAQTFEKSGQSADIAIGNLPFRLAFSDGEVGQRETAPVRKQQFDASQEAGEQSLEQSYWLRSQTSFHRGAGVVFYEPGSEEEAVHRFAESVGVNPWTRGELSLLKKMDEAYSSASAAYISSAVVGGEDRLVVTAGGSLLTVKPDGTTTTAVTLTGSGATRAAVFGGTAWVGTDGGIDSVALATGTKTNRYTGSAASNVYWAKSRLFATLDSDVYELDPYESPAAALPTALYSHPLDDWTWSSVTEAPGAILLAGYAGGNGAIYKMVLEDDGATTTPRLGPPIQVAEFPPGEEVHSLRVYLGTYIGIGTSRGLRVGIVDASGALQYGPLIVETDTPVVDLAARDTFLYGVVEDGLDSGTSVVRVSLAEEIEPLRFAWAWDVQTKVSGTPTSLAMLGNTDRVAVAIDSDGVYLTSATEYETTGHLVTGRIRYGTAEPKSFQLARLSASFAGDDTVVLSVRDVAGNDRSVITYTVDIPEDEDIALRVDQPGQYISLRLDLNATDDGTGSPTVESWILKALPTPKRQRLISYPLLCLDSEKDRFGVTHGARNSGYAWSRYHALEALEEAGAVVTVQDFTTDESYLAQIESIRFSRRKPPDRNHPGFGGIATVIVRKLS